MSEVRCFMRYNNQGQLFRTCNNKKAGSTKKTKPAVITPLITPNEFIAKLNSERTQTQKDKGFSYSYANLTPAQRTNYHRLDMANRRQAERKVMKGNKEALETYKLEMKEEREKAKLKKLKLKEEKAKTKEAKKKLKAELKNKQKSYSKLKKELDKQQDIEAKIKKDVVVSFD